MPEYSQIVRTLSEQKFNEILGASSRKAKEVYFHRHGIKAPKQAMHKIGQKNEARTQKLFEVLQQQTDDELCEEMLRTWLLTKRPLLSAALDYLNIPHENGLTESNDVEKIASLSDKELQALSTKLEEVSDKEDIGVYLKFMGAR